jgi:hypothetical protein
MLGLVIGTGFKPDDERNIRSKHVELYKNCRINTYKEIHLVGLFIESAENVRRRRKIFGPTVVVATGICALLP